MPSVLVFQVVSQLVASIIYKEQINSNFSRLNFMLMWSFIPILLHGQEGDHFQVHIIALQQERVTVIRFNSKRVTVPPCSFSITDKRP